ncbi:MAG: hypothetical protein RIS92_2666 [Verrucomicrobiota bacterium]
MNAPWGNFRMRLLLWHGALSAVLIFGFGVSVFHLEKTRRYAEVDAHLTSLLGLLSDALRKERRPEKDLPLNASEAINTLIQNHFHSSSSHYFGVWLRNPHPVLASPLLPENRERPSFSSSTPVTRDGFREICLSAAPVDLILVGIKVDGLNSELANLLRRLVLIGSLLQCISMVPGIWLSRRAAAPIEAIAHAAKQIASGNLKTRITIGPEHGEVSVLASKLNLSFAQLEDLFLQQTRFTSDAAHELRTPIAIILSQSQSILRRNRTKEEYQEAISAIARGAERMRCLLSTLFRLAKIDSHREQPAQLCVDLQKTLAPHIELLQDQSRTAEVGVTIDISPTFAHVDPSHLDLILSNLLNNALQHNLPNGSIHVSSLSNHSEATVTIKNSSLPIPPDLLPRLFDRFFQIDSSRTGGHAGLGLSIARELTRLNNGRLHITNADGFTTVTLTLPKSTPSGTHRSQ